MINYSVILPVFDEIKILGNCLASLAKQTIAKEMEIIVVDDGSTDGSAKYATYRQSHQGPGAARNLGASKAKGKILVFVDADMEFAPDFIEKLAVPILASQEQLLRDRILGTFSKEEYLLNKDNIWARYWNLNLGRAAEKMLPADQPDTAPVFRAILKEEFLKVGGFDPKKGYTDDWSLSGKLGVLAVSAPGAKYYHQNPDALKEVWTQARWFGKNEFLTKNLVRRLYNLFRYCPFWALARIFDPKYFVFTLVYNSAVFISVLLSFLGEPKHK